ncbi:MULTISPECIES: hypothetical protein [Candidatus Protochlamydia]|uniref:hypothetical protein n=1 Tax=Candidatus Protochlamydia TaxID=282132 RepID=UPI00057ED9E3|nr:MULTISPECIES: hypothetical protein [Protochlamydia]
MFKKRKIALIGILINLILGGIWFYSTPSADDVRNYRKLMEYSDRSSKKNEKHNKAFETQQNRTQVTKQILFMKDQVRLQWRLMSEKSELKLSQIENAIELVEFFTEVTCQCQEQLDACSNTDLSCHPSQLLRYLRAKKATYHYQTEQLTADDVQLARYKIKGHQWINDLQAFHPWMKGSAKRIQLSFSQNDRSFTAQDLQAAFQDWGELL